MTKPLTDYQIRDALKDSVTERNMRRRAAEVCDALKATRGTVSAPTVEEVYSDLAMGVRVLLQRPDLDFTQGIVGLRRNSHDSTDFTILLNVGNVGVYNLPVEEAP